MKRYHVEFTERVDHFGDSIVSGVTTGDGTFKGIFNYDGDDAAFIESLLNDDENVIQFELEDRDLVSNAAAMLGRKGGSAKSDKKARSSAKNGKLGGRPSGKLVAKWSDDIKVGIWDNEVWTLRLYDDRAVLKYPTVKWVDNSGSLDHKSARITGRTHAALVKIASEQVADAEDYTEQVKELIWDLMD